ncbi:MAG: Holliday junction resolvase RuvX [Gemmatimonadales bacterium]|nr:MAG: Holliday junction resolvase RuvX [Gemmatimonadales bacterium]
MLMGPSNDDSPGRIMAIDYGRRRIGIAASDPLRIVSKPRCVIAAGIPPEQPTRELLELVSELEPTIIVVGLPLNMDCTEGEMALEARRFARHLGVAAGIPIVERDERLSSVEAERTIHELGLPKKKRQDRGLRDMIAAAILLEDYMRETPG